MSTEPSAPETCYRHPAVPTRVHCTRCSRPICPDCMNPAPVGHHCPTCVAEAGREVRRRRVRIRRPRSVTSLLLGSNAVMFLVELALGSATSVAVLVTLGAMVPSLIAEGQYWRLITSMFLHVGVLHLVLNLYVLYLFGGVLESVLGSARFTAVYFITGFCGSAASFALGGTNRVAAGASGAIFGLLGAWLAYNWRRRRLSVAAQGNLRVALVLIGVNLVLGVAVRGIDNAAHVGGLVAGLIAGLTVEGFGRGRVRTAAIVGGFVTLTAAGALLVTWRVTTLAGA